jgi:HAD domain in Swiss Army Knife RNA repair proteins
MTIHRLVFLDFDGVLHPGLAGTLIYLPNFEAFLRVHTEVGVVLSTSWREQTPFAELVSYFSPDLRERIVGVTPDFADGPGGRLSEILAWLTQHRFMGPWVALDDDVSLFPGGCHNLVLCNPARGLRQPQLEAACTILGLNSH